LAGPMANSAHCGAGSRINLFTKPILPVNLFTQPILPAPRAPYHLTGPAAWESAPISGRPMMNTWQRTRPKGARRSARAYLERAYRRIAWAVGDRSKTVAAPQAALRSAACLGSPCVQGRKSRNAYLQRRDLRAWLRRFRSDYCQRCHAGEQPAATACLAEVKSNSGKQTCRW
jgi:hypothetical protein